MSPSCSIVIPARDAEGDLGECLVALRPEAGSVPWDVLVVDDGSRDGTAALARAHGARVIRQSGLGPAAARNAGARAADGELLVFFDADCVPERGCVEALLAPFADPEVAGARGAYTSSQRSVIARFVQLELDEKQARLAASPRIAVVDTACAAYRRAVFLEAGGFDESFPATSAEDVEFSFRLAARGARLVFAAGARVRHRHPDRLGTYLRRKLRFGFFRAKLYGRYPDRLRQDGYTPRLMPLQIALAGLLVALAALAPWLEAARWAVAVAVLAFLATAVPMVGRAWKGGPGLAAAVVPLLLARSLAQGFGLLAGFTAQTFSLRASPATLPVLSACGRWWRRW